MHQTRFRKSGRTRIRYNARSLTIWQSCPRWMRRRSPVRRKKPRKYLSETDPEAAWSLKDAPGRFGYETNYLVDTDHGIIVDVEGTPARLSQEVVSAKEMLDRSRTRHDFRPDRVAADGSYGTGPFLASLLKRKVTPHVPVLDRQHQTKGKYDLSHFRYDPARDSYTFLEGHEMPLHRIRKEDRIKSYFAGKDTCGTCPIKKACTDAPFRTVTRHMDEEARQTVRDLCDTAAYDESRRRRKKVEMLFAHLKTISWLQAPPARRPQRSQRRIPPRRHRPEPKTSCQNGTVLRVKTSSTTNRQKHCL